jgi:hypothetical protein
MVKSICACIDAFKEAYGETDHGKGYEFVNALAKAVSGVNGGNGGQQQAATKKQRMKLIMLIHPDKNADYNNVDSDRKECAADSTNCLFL